VALVPPLQTPICVEGLGPCESGPAGPIANICQAVTPQQPVTPMQFNEKVRELNDLIIASFPPGRTIDFYSIVNPLQVLGTPGDYADFVHFSATGQQKRADKAFDWLFWGY
jgi:hypothetical protein